jgi:hypothetical protein
VEVHKPKAAHSWREFAREMGAVVLGILIALGAEQAVEAGHWAHAVREGEASLKEEVATQADFYTLRVAVRDCVVRRLDLIEGIVQGERAGVHQAPVGRITYPRGALIRRDAWGALSAGAVLTHLPPERLLGYSTIYSQAMDIRGWEIDEENAWDALRLVEGDPNRLSPADLSQVRTSINLARRLNSFIAGNAGLQLGRIKSLGVRAPKPRDLSQQRECQPIVRG